MVCVVCTGQSFFFSSDGGILLSRVQRNILRY